MSNVTVTATNTNFSALQQLIAQRPISTQPPPAPRPTFNLIPMDQLIASRMQAPPAPVPAVPVSFARPVAAQASTQVAPAVRPLAPAAQPAASTIGLGAKGQAVTRIQQDLQKWGYQLKDDGDYGNRTARTVSQFQRDQGISATGTVNQVTLQALERSPAQTPAISELRAGRGQLGLGAKGETVSYIQSRLNVWGYKLGTPDGDFGSRTQSAVREFQQAHGIQVNGRVGQATLSALDKTPVTAGKLQTNGDAQRLARTAQNVAARRDTVGWCYSGVATAVSKALGVELYGGSAYQASGILARNDDFKEVKSLKPSDLPKLPAGAIVVWGKTGASPNGHISVALGNGREASDHIGQQLTNLRGHTNFRVFMPVG